VLKPKVNRFRSKDNLRRAAQCPGPHDPQVDHDGYIRYTICGFVMPKVYAQAYIKGKQDTLAKLNRMSQAVPRQGFGGFIKRIFSNGG